MTHFDEQDSRFLVVYEGEAHGRAAEYRMLGLRNGQNGSTIQIRLASFWLSMSTTMMMLMNGMGMRRMRFRACSMRSVVIIVI